MGAAGAMAAGGDSRTRMLEAAIDLMRGSGLSGAGINEIVRASDAPKGSVYHHFPAGKLQIVTEAIGVYSDRVRQFMAEAMRDERTAEGKVEALFSAFARRVEDGAFSRSCAVGAVSLDLTEDLEGFRAVLAATFEEWIELLAAEIDLGDPRRSRSFAGLVLTAVEGAYIRARAERTARPFREAGQWLVELARPA